MENKLVNEAWNEGVAKASGKYILVLNDDIIIYDGTINKMMLALETNVVSGPYFKRSEDDDKIYTSNGKNIVGFCYMFKRKDKDMLFPIDNRLKCWFGDNWIYHKADRKIGWGGFVYHWESKTIFSDEQKAKTLELIEGDKVMRQKIKLEQKRI